MVSSFINWFWKPTSKFAWGAILIVGGLLGVIFWGGFHTAMEATNTQIFCISCHEMEQNVYEEYKQTIHYTNRTGVRATCSDCHVPDPWIHKIIRKIQASNEVLHKVMGTIDTPEKFEDKRLTLAKNVWKSMKHTDSRECRNCHSWEAMSDTKQKLRAGKRHKEARTDGMTCIDCHKGIAHRAVHVLLDEDEDPYDGKPDARRLPYKSEVAKERAAREAAQKIADEKAAALKAEADKLAAEKAAADKAAADKLAAEQPAANAAASGGDTTDWSSVPAVDITTFYPGQSSIEWVFNGKDHGGARAVRRANDRCAECHKGEEADMGAKIVTGEKAETTPIPGKRGSIAVKVRATHDETNLSMNFQWPDVAHTPAPFVDGGKMDPENQVKLAVMFDDGKVEMAGFVGCWATCHHDSNYMPDQPKPDALPGAVGDRIDVSKGVTKYIPESRTEFEYKGRNKKPRGAWDKLLEPGEMDAKKAEGVMMDLLRYSSSGKVESGSVMEQRVLAETTDSTAIGTLKDGVWNVTLTRPLKSDKPGGVSIEPGQIYTIGFAIHDDFTSARFHHVSLEYKLGLDNAEAEINVIKK